MYVFGAHNTYSPGGEQTPKIVCSVTLSAEEDAPIGAVLHAVTDSASDVLEEILSKIDPEEMERAKSSFWDDVAARFTNITSPTTEE